MAVRDGLVTAPVVGLWLAGYVKGSPALAWVPVDLTLAAMVALSVAGVVELARSQRLPRGWAPLVLLAGTFLIGLMSSIDTGYEQGKVTRLLLLTIPAAFLSAVVVSTPERLWWVARWTLGGGLGLGLLLIYAPSTADLFGRYATEGGDTISIGRGCGAALVAAVAMAAGRRLRWPLALVAVVVLVAIVLGSGSRGPLLGSGVGVLAVVLTRPGRRVRYLAAGGALAFLVGPWLLARTSSAALDRILLLFAGGGDSVAAREHLYSDAAAMGASRPFGAGWGGFEQVSPLQRYPHNMMLEVFAEAGWFAAGALAVTVAIALGRLLRVAQTPEAGATLGLLVFWLTNAMFSGDVNDNRAAFTMLAVGLTLPVVLHAVERGDLHEPDAAVAPGARRRSVR